VAQLFDHPYAEFLEHVEKPTRYTGAEHGVRRKDWNSVDCRLQWRRLIEAVKARDVSAALSTFRSPQTATFLTIRLAEQVWLRGNAALRGAVRSSDSAGAHV